MFSLHPLQYEDLVRKELQGDLAIAGDLTSNLLLSKQEKLKATVVAREKGFLAGLEVGLSAFKTLDSDACVAAHKKDGDFFEVGETLATVFGAAVTILSAERTCLNIISHLSGIASATARMVAAVSKTQAKIVDTRKTLPGLRVLQKYAVRCGGGLNHRYSLDGALLIKDNHIKNLKLSKALIDDLRGRLGHTVKIEIEVDTLEQLGVLLPLPIDAVLLDNMTVETLTQAVAMVAGRFKTEASGGINEKNVRQVALSGVDYISCGALTHSAAAIDVSLDLN